MTKFENIGATHALEALDQADCFGGRDPALESYFTNLLDTLNEMSADADGVRKAYNGFEKVLTDRGISYRPHGL